jgi:hypothetical protein
MQIDRTPLAEALRATANTAARGSRLIADFATQPRNATGRVRAAPVQVATAAVVEPIRTVAEFDENRSLVQAARWHPITACDAADVRPRAPSRFHSVAAQPAGCLTRQG